MGEGRYRTLLCLIQLAVPGIGNPAHPENPDHTGIPPSPSVSS